MFQSRLSTYATYFNPRSPRGERPPDLEPIALQDAFQSTLPSRGATFLSWYSFPCTIFQSTLPSRGATQDLKNGP